jgi:large subunit ribosomal protein L25
METVTIEARPRSATGKGPSRRLRREGFIPAVTYCRGTETVAIEISRERLRSILRSDKGRNSLITLAVAGGQSYSVMVKDYVVHPVTRQLLHADFQQVDLSLPVEVEIPFRTVGKSKGEAAGGTLLQNLRHLRVRCQPANIPLVIEANVSELEIDSVLRVRELTLPGGIELLHREDQKLVVVKPPRVEEAPKPAEGEAVEGEAAAEGEVKPEGEAAAAEGEAKGEGEGKAEGKGKGEGKGEGKGKREKRDRD